MLMRGPILLIISPYPIRTHFLLREFQDVRPCSHHIVSIKISYMGPLASNPNQLAHKEHRLIKVTNCINKLYVNQPIGYNMLTPNSFLCFSRLEATIPQMDKFGWLQVFGQPIVRSMISLQVANIVVVVNYSHI